MQSFSNSSNFDLFSHSTVQPFQGEVPSQEAALADVEQRLAEIRASQMNLQKKQEERKLLPQEPSFGVSSELVDKMKLFMTNTEAKLAALDDQMQRLSIEIQASNARQAQQNNTFASQLSSIESRIPQKEISLEKPVFVPYTENAPSFEVPSFVQPIPSQEEQDAELAKKLQEEFDNENASQASPNVIAPVNFSNPPQLVAPVAPVSLQKENCPLCGLAFIVGKELTEHADSHFNERQPRPLSSEPQQRVIMNVPQQNSNNSGFFSKMFGKSSKPQQLAQPQPPAYSPYYTYQSQAPQQVPEVYRPQPVYVNSYVQN